MDEDCVGGGGDEAHLEGGYFETVYVDVNGEGVGA